MSIIENHTARIVKNSIYNLLGFFFPVVTAIIFIPTLLEKLGDEKFGLLNIIWIVVGYFSLFDFGLGRTLTKIISEKLSSQDMEGISEVFWTAFYLILLLSIAGSIIFCLFTPILVNSVLKISVGIKKETILSFYIMAFSIPVITTTSAFRGFLEAYQNFKLINILRIFWGVSTFVVPIIVLIYTDYLTYIVFSLVILRIIMWITHLYICFKTEKKLINFNKLNIELIKPIFVFGGWITITNIIGPVIVYIDRFLIGALISATAITYFATPFEVVSKLLLIPGAIVGVLYPVMTYNYVLDFEIVREIYLKGIKYIILLVVPIMIMIMVYAKIGLSIWVGLRIADQSWVVMQLLTVGIFFNCLAQIPFTYLQAIGKPNTTGLLHLVELPIYFITMWFSIKLFGIKGAATIFLFRAFIDALLLFILSREIYLNKKYKISKLKLVSVLLIMLIVISLFIVPLTTKIIFSVFFLIFYFTITWKVLLNFEEKSHLLALIRFRNKN